MKKNQDATRNFNWRCHIETTGLNDLDRHNLQDPCSLTPIVCMTCSLIVTHACQQTGRTPLAFAAYKGQTSICRLLLEKGANINTQDSDGK